MSPLTIWIILGMVLLTAEMLTGTFMLIFIALGCLVAALMAALVTDSIAVQIVGCAIVSVLGVYLLRKPLQRKLLKSVNIQADVGKEILIDRDIPPHDRARISYQGTTWDALNSGTEEIRQGDRVTIVGIDGNMLLIRKVN